MLLRELHKQAQLEGGAVYMLNGNHESLNVSGNFRYLRTAYAHLSAVSSAGSIAYHCIHICMLLPVYVADDLWFAHKHSFQ